MIKLTDRATRSRGRRLLGMLATTGLLTVGCAADASADSGPELVSRTPAGAAGNGLSGVFGVAVAASGGTVAFSSSGTDLGPVDLSPVPDIYVKRLDGTGPMTLASAAPDGSSGNALSTRPSLSADGARVAFLSAATNLDPRAGEQLPGAFVTDLSTGDVRLVSTTADGIPANGPSSAVAISADGRTVAFVSRATNLSPDDADTDPDVYVKNIETGDVALASVSSDGSKPAVGYFGVGSVSSSADGSKVAFSTDAALSPTDDNGRADVYVKDLASGDVQLASSTPDGTAGNATSARPTLTAGGDKVVFESFASDLDARDTSPDSDVYVKDLVSGDVTLASTNAADEKADAGASEPAISADGGVVSFASRSTNLGATPSPRLQVFVKLLTTGEVTRISAAPNGAPGDGTSLLSALSADGSQVAFSSSSTNLCIGDANRVSDVYLAHPLGLGGLRAGAADTEAAPADGDAVDAAASA